ncbi:MAG TPA: phage baseplate assembly protein V [Burkholderiales bacterium]|nr:phage baseplate assembly protein V [Burkholderiales bacterium]
MSDLHQGVVIDANDPHGELRLKVQVPTVLGEKSIWALPFVAGRHYSAPAVGERVWVAFEQDDTERALWMGSMSV